MEEVHGFGIASEAKVLMLRSPDVGAEAPTYYEMRADTLVRPYGKRAERRRYECARSTHPLARTRRAGKSARAT